MAFDFTTPIIFVLIAFGSIAVPSLLAFLLFGMIRQENELAVEVKKSPAVRKRLRWRFRERMKSWHRDF